jgi:lipopolysaccharide transport system permease protein
MKLYLNQVVYIYTMNNELNIEYEIKPVGKVSLGINELLRYYELFYYFTWRDIKVKYKQTVLGFLWAVLQPFIMMIVFSLFFSNIIKMENKDVPYPVFVYSGLLLWNVFSLGLSSAGNSMISNAGIIKKIYFPRLIIPLSAVLVALFDFLMAFLMYIIMLFYYGITPKAIVIIYLPLSLLITVITTFGIGCWLSALTVKYRDFRYVVPFLIQLLMFVSPIIYPVNLISNPILQKLLMFNPIAGAVSLFRFSFTAYPFDVNTILYSSVTAIAFFIYGLYFFRKTEYYFADLA